MVEVVEVEGRGVEVEGRGAKGGREVRAERIRDSVYIVCRNISRYELIFP